MERKSDHSLLFVKVYTDHAIIICHLARTQFTVVLRTLVYVVVMLDLFVCNPYGAEASCLGGHDVDAIAEIDRQVLHAGACKLKHFVFYKAAVEHSLYQRYGHIVRAYTLARASFKPHQDHFRSLDVPGIVKKLFNKLSATFADTHVSERTVTCVAV